MIIHHVTSLRCSADRHTYKILSSCDRQVNFLAACDEIEFKIKKIPQSVLCALRTSSKNLILDSGVLGAAKSGHPEWMINGVSRVSYWGNLLQANRIAHVDVPSEPHILKMLGISVGEAREITVKNAGLSLQDESLEGKRIISVQGWTLDDRKKCLELLMPIIEQDKNAWIGNGSTCMLTPQTGLYKFYEWLCRELPDRHIHAWGIGNTKWLVELNRLGVSSGDSGTAGFANGMNEEISPITGQRITRVWLGKRDGFLSALGFIKNMEAIEQSFEVLRHKNGKYDNNGKSNQLSLL